MFTPSTVRMGLGPSFIQQWQVSVRGRELLDDLYLLFEPAHVIARLMTMGEITSEEIVERTLSRIQERNSLINAFITLTAEQARNEARAADKRLRLGERRGPLDGIPIVLKDLFATRGVRTTSGSKVMSSWIPDSDAHVVAKLQQAGLVSLGKTGMPEFASCPCSANPHYGPVRNPWNPTFDTLGSSSGTAAAVADGMAYFGPGSDTGGSVRLPASTCALVGLKPTYGRISLKGVHPLCPGQDHVGLIARDATDVAYLFDLLSGFDPQEQPLASVPFHPVSNHVREGVKGLRVAYIADDGQGSVDPQVTKTVRDAVDVLSQVGAQVDQLELVELADFFDPAMIIWESEAAGVHGHLVRTSADELDPAFLDFISRGLGHSAVDLVEAQWAMKRILDHVEHRLNAYDLAVTPTVDGFPPLVGERRKGLVRFTAPWNFNGWPALSVPIGFGTNRIPIGLQVIAKPWNESLAIRAAYVLEQRFRVSVSAERNPVMVGVG
jgi:aspartyl-tRNA(Asn)/glutamyl-tRNA(Gln) amidotransferase subunit A